MVKVIVPSSDVPPVSIVQPNKWQMLNDEGELVLNSEGDSLKNDVLEAILAIEEENKERGLPPGLDIPTSAIRDRLRQSKPLLYSNLQNTDVKFICGYLRDKVVD